MPKNSFGIREDGTNKGKGWLGLIKRRDGSVMSELSMSIGLDGKDVLIPTIVPTLSKKEIDFLASEYTPGEELPQPIMDKAVKHALERIKSGESPFFD